MTVLDLAVSLITALPHTHSPLLSCEPSLHWSAFGACHCPPVLRFVERLRGRTSLSFPLLLGLLRRLLPVLFGNEEKHPQCNDVSLKTRPSIANSTTSTTMMLSQRTAQYLRRIIPIEVASIGRYSYFASTYQRARLSSVAIRTSSSPPASTTTRHSTISPSAKLITQTPRPLSPRPSLFSLHNNNINLISKRTYVFFPTSWTELKLRLRQRPVQATVLRVLLPRRPSLYPKPAKPWKLWRRRWAAARRRSTQQWLQNWSAQRTRVRDFWRHTQNVARQRVAVARQRATQRWRHHTQRIILHVRIADHVDRHWFDAHGRPHVARDATGRFVNPWTSQSANGVKSLRTLWMWRAARFRREWREYGGFWGWFLSGVRDVLPSSNIIVRGEKHSRWTGALQHLLGMHSSSNHASAAHAKKLLSPQRRYPWTKAPTNPSILRLSWIGHSTCLVQRQQTTILTDPIFSHRASPFQWTPIGVGRSQPAACEIDDLPPYIDLCIISHDHYDHLDKASVQALRERVGLWVVPLGTQKWMTRKAGVAPERVLEMKWWESVLLRRNNNRRQADKAATPLEIVQRHSLRDNPSDAHPARDRPSASPEEEGGEEVWITCLPVQHWCSRTIWDRNYRLWASFAVLFPDQQQTFYYTGDTAWPAQNFPLFDQIRCYLPWPVSLAAIPIGAYNPKELNEDSHVSPPEAVQIHQALQAQQSVAIHHGSFPLSEEPLDEPSEWLSRATAEAGVAPRAFTTLPHGAALECKTVVPKALKR